MRSFTRRMSVAALLMSSFFSPAAAQSGDGAVGQLLASPKVKQALETLKASEPQTINEQIKICEIPAPSFKEEQRAAWFKRRFAELGLKSVRIDKAGNVLGE